MLFLTESRPNICFRSYPYDVGQGKTYDVLTLEKVDGKPFWNLKDLT